MSNLVRVGKLIGHMKYLMRSVKRGEEAVEICSDDIWDVKMVNSLYNMVSGRFNFKGNRKSDSFSWSLVISYLYTRRGYNIVELN